MPTAGIWGYFNHNFELITGTATGGRSIVYQFKLFAVR
jgi:hypothetical protein